MNPNTYAALLSIAASIANDNSTLNLTAAFEPIDNWQEASHQAEIHGLSVMFGQLARDKALNIPRELRLQLTALTLRHQKVLVAREIVLAEVIEAFNQNNIDFVLLKGAALSHLIYAPSWLRPMRDIDVLVRKQDAQPAQTLLRTIGFENQDFKPGYLFEHHHLPNSMRQQDGFTISLEVHHDALSGDVDGSISFDNLREPPRAFPLAGKQAYALSHLDMLNHLCHHTFEPAEVIKLGSMVDLVRYANRFTDEINWHTLEKEQPEIGNTLRCIHALLPLPETLISKLGMVPNGWQPGGLGRGFKPLSRILALPTKRAKFAAMLLPSSWWLHIFYAIPPEKSLLHTRLIRHPFTLGKWLFRRYRAAHKSKEF